MSLLREFKLQLNEIDNNNYAENDLIKEYIKVYTTTVDKVSKTHKGKKKSKIISRLQKHIRKHLKYINISDDNILALNLNGIEYNISKKKD